MQEVSHKIEIEQRKSLSVTGVEFVKSFAQNRIVLSLVGGNSVFILGAGLKITGFSKTTGLFSAVGSVESVRYGGGFKTRIFK